MLGFCYHSLYRLFVHIGIVTNRFTNPEGKKERKEGSKIPKFRQKNQTVVVRYFCARSSSFVVRGAAIVTSRRRKSIAQLATGVHR
jgi:hypothetical protein